MVYKTIIYRINEQDIIYSIEGPWDEFALENDGYPENQSKNILGNPIWKYITDFETKHIYKLILDHVRLLKKEITIPIMCDAPTMLRFIDLTIIPLVDNNIEFVSQITKEVKRQRVNILDKNISRNEQIIKMCSYCKAIQVDENNWMETAEAVSHLKLFNKKTLPKISHGVCSICYNSLMQELEQYKLSFNQLR